MTRPFANVRPDDLVHPVDWGGTGPEVGHVLAVLPVPGRWPDLVVVLPGGRVATWHRWSRVSDEEAGQ
jgi:hypothetical protein